MPTQRATGPYRRFFGAPVSVGAPLPVPLPVTGSRSVSITRSPTTGSCAMPASSLDGSPPVPPPSCGPTRVTSEAPLLSGRPSDARPSAPSPPHGSAAGGPALAAPVLAAATAGAMSGRLGSGAATGPTLGGSGGGAATAARAASNARTVWSSLADRTEADTAPSHARARTAPACCWVAETRVSPVADNCQTCARIRHRH
jgi:hypothetical protein